MKRDWFVYGLSPFPKGRDWFKWGEEKDSWTHNVKLLFNWRGDRSQEIAMLTRTFWNFESGVLNSLGFSCKDSEEELDKRGIVGEETEVFKTCFQGLFAWKRKKELKKLTNSSFVFRVEELSSFFQLTLYLTAK